MFSELLNAIQTSAAQIGKRPFIIAISGFGGSGKSTLASQLQKALLDSAIISIDSFVTDHLSKRSAEWEGFDRIRFCEEVLVPASNGKPIIYSMYDWKENTTTQHKTVAPNSFLIVEGCSILHPALIEYYDFSVWVDVPLEEATKRGMERDRNQGAGSEWANRWLDIWMPNEHDFFEKYRPVDKVDFIYSQAHNY